MAPNRYFAYGVSIESEIAFPEISRSSRTPTHVVVSLAGGPPDPDVRWFHRWRVPADSSSRSRRVWLAFGRLGDGYRLRFRDLADFDVSSNGTVITCRPAAGLPESTLRHLLLDQVLPLALNHSGRLVLHASAVHVPRIGAIAFAGGAGAGKSTLAAALAARGCPLIADDALIVIADDEGFAAVPSYPGVRLWTRATRGLRLGRTARLAHYSRKRRTAAASLPFRPAPSTLRAVFCLGRRAGRQASQTRQLGAADRVLSLVRGLYLMDAQDRALLERTFSAIAAVVDRVPVLELRLRHAPHDLRGTAGEVLALARRAVDS